MDFYFETSAERVFKEDGKTVVETSTGELFAGDYCILSSGRSGSKWMESVCEGLGIPTQSSRIDIGVRVEVPFETFSHLTDKLYESKIVYRSKNIRTASELSV